MNSEDSRIKVNLKLLDGKYKAPKGQGLNRSLSGIGFVSGSSFVDEEA